MTWDHTIWVISGDRLFDPLCRMLLIIDAASVGISLIKSGRFDEQVGLALRSGHFSLQIDLPRFVVLRAVAEGVELNNLELNFRPIPAASAATHTGKQSIVAGFGIDVLNAVTPVFVNFFEQNKDWIRTKFGGPTHWTGVFGFAWFVRNAVSHAGGRVSLRDPNVKIAWEAYQCTSQDDGQPFVGSAFQLADLIILLRCFSDALDREGAPR